MILEFSKKYKSLAKRMSTISGQKIGAYQLMLSALDTYYNSRDQALLYRAWRREVFDEIYNRDGGRCLWCHSSLLPKESTLDHLTPTDRGGKKMKKSNVTICCLDCNLKKGNLTPEEYLIKLGFK